MLYRDHERLDESTDLPTFTTSNINGIKFLCDRILSRPMDQEELFKRTVEIAIQSIRLVGNVNVDEIPQSRLKKLVANAKEDIYAAVDDYI